MLSNARRASLKPVVQMVCDPIPCIASAPSLTIAIMHSGTPHKGFGRAANNEFEGGSTFVTGPGGSDYRQTKHSDIGDGAPSPLNAALSELHAEEGRIRAELDLEQTISKCGVLPSAQSKDLGGLGTQLYGELGFRYKQFCARG
jgi:hypothetical protein